MTDLTYIVEIDHKEKGIGFTAKTALKNAQKQKTSPITNVRFSKQPTGSHTTLEVTIKDTPLTDIITSVIESSGRMPTTNGSYSIKSIELQKKEDNLQEKMKSLQRKQGSFQRQLTTLREENAQLRKSLTQQHVEVDTPLEGLLAYFSTTDYSPEVVLDNPADIDFAQRVLSGDTTNLFVNYANHVLGECLTQEEVDTILNYKAKDSTELSALHLRYEIAKKELDFLKKLKSGDTEIPETLRAEYIKVIEEKGHDETVRAYESTVQEQEEAQLRQKNLRQLKENYDSFSEQVTLLTQVKQEVPVIINHMKSSVEIYFPFVVRDVKAGFIGDLKKEIETYFEGATIEQIDNTFVAYRIHTNDDSAEEVDHLVEETPVTLQVAGFNKIVPYRLG